MFFAACEGYFDKIDEQQQITRRLAVIVHQSLGGKGTEEELWQLFGDKITRKIDKKIWGSKDEANDLRKAIEAAHGIKLN